MIAVPTRELSGQVLASASARWQARGRTFRFGPTDGGSVTSAVLSAASSGSNLSVVVSGGRLPLRVVLGEPSAPSAVGEKPSESQPVGVNTDVFSENVGISYEFTRPTEVSGPQE